MCTIDFLYRYTALPSVLAEYGTPSLCKPLRALRGARGRAGLTDRVGIAIFPVADSAADSAADLAPDLAADLAVHAETMKRQQAVAQLPARGMQVRKYRAVS